MNTPAILHLGAAAALAACLPATAEPVAFSTYPEVRTAAKQTGRDFVVFFAGPSWLPETAAVTRALASPGFRSGLQAVAGWALVPAAPPTPGSEVNPADKPDFNPYDLPTLALVDPSGRTFAVAEGITPANLPPALKSLAAAQPGRTRRDKLLDQARDADGKRRAKLLGQALDQVAFRFSRQRRDVLDQIKAADPADATGYWFKYTFIPGGFHESTTRKLISERKQQELMDTVDRHLTNPVLLPAQRQALLSARMQAHRSLDDIPNAVATLRQIVALDPRSELGTGAAQYIRLLTEPVRLPRPAWESYDNRPLWLPLVADLSAQVTAPGTYQIEFRHLAGRTRFRKVTLKSAGREIASDPNTAESTKVRLVVPASAKGRPIELWAESQGTGWFDGRGEIVVTKEP